MFDAVGMVAGHRTKALQLVTFTTFAIAQPLFDVLGRAPTFFSNEAAGPLTIVLYSFAIACVPPLVLIALGVLATSANATLGAMVHRVMLLVLGALIFVPPLKRVSEHDLAIVSVAMVLSGAITVLLERFDLVRRLTMIAALSLPVAVCAFLFVAPVSVLLDVPMVRPVGGSMTFEQTPPIVLFRLDELPLSSLLRSDGGIDAARFPNFARLATGATWYRDTTATSTATRWAVPGLYTGRVPEHDAQLLPSDHPRSLFTALGGAYSFTGGTEGICPPTVCRVDNTSVAVTSRRLLWHSAAIYGHIVGPRALERAFPPPEAFGLPGNVDPPTAHDGRADAPDPQWQQAVDVIDSIHPSPQPRFAVVSTNLPHHPWTMLPTGQAHSAPGYTQPQIPRHGAWSEDDQAVRAAYQAHLSQVGAVDSLLGRLLDRLEKLKMFDRALLIVVGDHGASFLPGAPFRDPPTDATVADLSAVPFFIKFPKQGDGRIDKRRAETTDLTPTIFDVLGINPNWRMDGLSLLSSGGHQRRVIRGWDGEPTVIPGDLPELVEAAANRKYRFLGLPQRPVSSLEAFFAVGAHRDLIGKRVSDLDRQEPSDLRFGLVDASRYADVEIDGVAIPAAITAVTESRAEGVPIAVAVNGRIATVSETIRWRGQTRIDGLFWPGLLKAGANRIDLYELHLEEDEQLVLHRIRVGGRS